MAQLQFKNLINKYKNLTQNLEYLGQLIFLVFAIKKSSSRVELREDAATGPQIYRCGITQAHQNFRASIPQSYNLNDYYLHAISCLVYRSNCLPYIRYKIETANENVLQCQAVAECSALTNFGLRPQTVAEAVG